MSEITRTEVEILSGDSSGVIFLEDGRRLGSCVVQFKVYGTQYEISSHDGRSLPSDPYKGPRHYDFRVTHCEKQPPTGETVRIELGRHLAVVRFTASGGVTVLDFVDQEPDVTIK